MRLNEPPKATTDYIGVYHTARAEARPRSGRAGAVSLNRRPGQNLVRIPGIAQAGEFRCIVPPDKRASRKRLLAELL